MIKCTLCYLSLVFITCLSPNVVARTHIFSGILRDTSDAPVANAIVYVEVYKNGVYDFAWTKSGKNGEIPATGYPSLQLKVKGRSGYSYCVFAEGLLPLVINTHRFVTKTSGIDLVLTDKHLKDLRLTYNPDLFHLDFPFETQPDLQQKVLLRENQPLVEAFLRWYKISASSMDGIPPDGQKKIDLLRSLVAEKSKRP